MKLPCYVHPRHEEYDEGKKVQTWWWVREEDTFPVCRCHDQNTARLIRDLLNSIEQTA
jgi:hypothetical protein